uniref:Uncharacterized protein n=1 Tax=Anopheles coluzzii TaxID=1518534 RepID=A0A8W7PI43_ANOCL
MRVRHSYEYSSTVDFASVTTESQMLIIEFCILGVGSYLYRNRRGTIFPRYGSIFSLVIFEIDCKPNAAPSLLFHIRQGELQNLTLFAHRLAPAAVFHDRQQPNGARLLQIRVRFIHLLDQLDQEPGKRLVVHIADLLVDVIQPVATLRQTLQRVRQRLTHRNVQCRIFGHLQQAQKALQHLAGVVRSIADRQKPETVGSIFPSVMSVSISEAFVVTVCCLLAVASVSPVSIPSCSSGSGSAVQEPINDKLRMAADCSSDC